MVARTHGDGARLIHKLPPWAIALLIVTAGLALYWPVFQLIPFEEDNVYALAWAASTPAARVLAVDPFFYPEWRPLAYATVWMEQRAGLPIASHFGINLALWIACAWLSYRIARQLAGTAIAGVVAAMLVISDPRSTWALVAIIERQTSLACAFGLSAILLVLPIERRLAIGRRLVLAVLLMAAMLSKEYGAAFTLALAGYAVLTKRGDVLAPALSAAVAYVALRFAVVGAIAQPYCEEMFLFGTVRDVCLEITQPSSFPQLAYNAAATLVNLPLLGLLSGSGEPIFAESRLLTGIVLTVLAIVAVTRGPREGRLLALVVIANALISVMIYRERNQLAGACAMAILAGIGVPLAARVLSSRRAQVVLGGVMIGVIAAQAALSHALVAERAVLASHIDPCRLEIMERDFVPAYAAHLKAAYGFGDAGCGH